MSSAWSHLLTFRFRFIGKQKVQRKLQSNDWGRFLDQGSAGRRQIGDYAGRFSNRLEYKASAANARVCLDRSGILQVKNGFNL